MTTCELEKEEVMPKPKVNNEDLEPIRKWASNLHPKAKSIAIISLWNDFYRVNIFNGNKAPDCVVEKITLSESYFIRFNGKKIEDLTKRNQTSKKNIFE